MKIAETSILVTGANSGLGRALVDTDMARGWMALAAAPSFAFMAAFTGIQGGGGHMCSAASHTSTLGGMVPMYLLMSAFHLTPWLKLVHFQRTPGRADQRAASAPVPGVRPAADAPPSNRLSGCIRNASTMPSAISSMLPTNGSSQLPNRSISKPATTGLTIAASADPVFIMPLAVPE